MLSILPSQHPHKRIYTNHCRANLKWGFFIVGECIHKCTLKVDRIQFVWVWVRPTPRWKIENQTVRVQCACVCVLLFCWGFYILPNGNWIFANRYNDDDDDDGPNGEEWNTFGHILALLNRNLFQSEFGLRILYIDLHTSPDIWLYCLIYFIGMVWPQHRPDDMWIDSLTRTH